MKKILLFVSAVALTTGAFAQSPTREGNVIIDPYIGVPNWANSLLYKTVENADDNYNDGENAANYSVNGGMLSYGGRVEYLVADNFGVGIDVNYEVSGYNYDTDSSYNSSTGFYDVGNFNRDYKAKKLRAMLRLNYHFVQNDRVDAYAGFAGGYKNVNRVRTTNDPNWETGTLPTLVPVTLRIAIGTRIYFTENIGVNMELGAFGGALLQFGLSAKF